MKNYISFFPSIKNNRFIFAINLSSFFSLYESNMKFCYVKEYFFNSFGFSRSVFLEGRSGISWSSTSGTPSTKFCLAKFCLAAKKLRAEKKFGFVSRSSCVGPPPLYTFFTRVADPVSKKFGSEFKICLTYVSTKQMFAQFILTLFISNYSAYIKCFSTIS